MLFYPHSSFCREFALSRDLQEGTERTIEEKTLLAKTKICDNSLRVDSKCSCYVYIYENRGDLSTDSACIPAHIASGIGRSLS